jgi:ubiquinone/menaquinone biosynthesis C-methylase UbiE
MDIANVKERTRKAYDKIGSDYDNWYWSRSAKNLRAGLTERVISILKKELKGKPRILDIGCGTGHLVRPLSELGEYNGLDISGKMIEHCRKAYPGKNFIIGDAENLLFKDDSFDCIVCFWSFHHLGSPSKALEEMRRVLKPDGLLLIATFKDARFNPMAKLADMSSTAYWGFITKRYSKVEMEQLLETFKNTGIEIYPTGLSVLNALGIRFLIATGRK